MGWGWGWSHCLSDLIPCQRLRHCHNNEALENFFNWFSFNVRIYLELLNLSLFSLENLYSASTHVHVHAWSQTHLVNKRRLVRYCFTLKKKNAVFYCMIHLCCIFLSSLNFPQSTEFGRELRCFVFFPLQCLHHVMFKRYVLSWLVLHADSKGKEKNFSSLGKCELNVGWLKYLKKKRKKPPKNHKPSK